MDRLSHDDRAVYFMRYGHPGNPLIRWDERELAKGESNRSIATSISPDERWLVRLNDQSLEVMPIAGGTWRTVASGPIGLFDTTSDGKWIYYNGIDAAGKRGLLRVPIGGGTSSKARMT